ncbi:MAG TPA: hypothetical protein VGD74_08150 [Vulgatibacter sp.]
MESLVSLAIERIPGCVAAGIADVRGGDLLAAISEEDAHFERLEVAAMAASRLFEEGRTARIASTFTPSDADLEDVQLPGEAVIVSCGEVHVFQRIGDQVLVALCAPEASFVGKILTVSREVAASARALPQGGA